MPTRCVNTIKKDEMSSKTQFKDALKESKKIITELREIIIARDKQISNLQSNCKFWQDCYVEASVNNEISMKKWWQFWK